MILYSVILPCRNEEKTLYLSLSSLIKSITQEYLIKTEFIVVDGCSTDSTRNEFDRLVSDFPNVNLKFLINFNMTVPFGLNMGIRCSKGDYIIRVDSHSVYPNGYLEKLVFYLDYLNADNVGGVLETIAFDSNILKSTSIAYCMSHKFGVGNSYFRIGSNDILEVDTVPFGCFRRRLFDEVGYFDEELTRNQDDEFNGRLKNRGMKIFLLPDLKIKYFARSRFKQVFLLFYQYGLFKPYVNLKLKKASTFRQFFPPFFVFYLFILSIISINNYNTILFIPLFLYLILSIISSFSRLIIFEEFIYRLVCFSIIHISYGLGYLIGVIKIYIFNIKFIKNDMKITR